MNGRGNLYVQVEVYNSLSLSLSLSLFVHMCNIQVEVYNLGQLLPASGSGGESPVVLHGGDEAPGRFIMPSPHSKVRSTSLKSTPPLLDVYHIVGKSFKRENFELHSLLAVSKNF